MTSRGKILYGKDKSYFDSFIIISSDFDEGCTCLINIGYLNSLCFVNTGSSEIEYSFNGHTLHGSLVPGTSTSSISFKNKSINKIWFRAPAGLSSVSVSASSRSSGSAFFIGRASSLSPSDNIAPTIQSAIVSLDGLAIVLTYNENLNESSIPLAGDFSLSGTFSEISSIDIDGLTVVIYLSSAVQIEETVFINYVSGLNPIEDINGNSVSNLTNHLLINNSIADYPVASKVGVFWWADDVNVANGADVLEWQPRIDNIEAGPWEADGYAPSLETTGWSMGPNGNVSCVRFTSGSFEFLKNDVLASFQQGEDPEVEFVVWFSEVSTIPARNTIISWGSDEADGVYYQFYRNSANETVWGDGVDTVLDGTQSQTFSQCFYLYKQNNGAGNTLNFHERALSVSALTRNAASKAITTCILGAVQDGNERVDFGNIRIRGIWFRHPDASPLTQTEREDIFRWSLGAKPGTPYYTANEQWHELAFYGQSNSIGRATESVVGLPDSNVRQWSRTIDTGITNPTALQDLQVRPNGADNRHGAWAYAQSLELPIPHHVLVMGQGGTSINLWNRTQEDGIYSTALRSEQIRAAHEFRGRMGGVPIPHVVWIHGESDVDIGTTQGTYISGLRTKINLIRALHGALCPVHLVNLCNEITVYGSVAAINAAFATVAGDPGVYLVDMSGETGVIGPDNLHYHGAGFQIMWNKIQTSILGE